MKRVLLILVFACFSVMMANAQVKKYSFDNTWQVSWSTPCVYDIVTGEISYTWTYWVKDNIVTKLQTRIKGSNLVGMSGDVYTVSVVHNENPLNWKLNSGNPYTYVLTESWEKNGMPFAVYHVSYHITYNAKGEITATPFNYKWECY